MSYINPAELFIDEYGFNQSPEGICAYAEYLLRESNAATPLPVDLDCIYRRFNMPKPVRRPLDDVQGLLASEAYGMVIVNENDPPARQRFTEAHELMEYVFKLLKARRSWNGQMVGNLPQNKKEQLCNLGAAELLMPRQLFIDQAGGRKVGFEVAQDLASTFQVSLTAALVRMIRLSHAPYTVVLFRHKHKPSELKEMQRIPTQMNFLSDELAQPSKKLRVEWAICNGNNVFVPQDKSVDVGTNIYRAWQDNTFTEGVDGLELGRHLGRFRCESMPFTVNDERLILSLILFA
jgi:hypothetical protein